MQPNYPTKLATSAVLFAIFPVLAARADTVFLKNGAWIDGRVTLKTDAFIELQIGKIGKIELPFEDIHRIEKNDRTGAESDLKTYVEQKGPVDSVGKAKGDAKTAKDDKKPEKADSKPGADSADAKDKDKTTINDKEKADSEDAGDGKKADDAPAGAHDLDPALVKRIQELIEDLQRQRSRNRVQAERHLEAIGVPSIPYLIPIAKSENELTRGAVMRLFASFGDQQVLDASIAALLDDSEAVRYAANKALKRITGEDFGYQSSASPRRRESAQRKWAEWWEKEKALLAEEKKLSGKK
jgi:hypothetical protein